MNHLRDSFVQLFAVREGKFTHFVVAPFLRRATLCGRPAPKTKAGAFKWRRVHTPGVHTCLTCQVRACSRPTRVVWS